MTVRKMEDGPLSASDRWRSGFIWSHLGMKASLARLAGARRPSSDALDFFDVA